MAFGLNFRLDQKEKNTLRSTIALAVGEGGSLSKEQSLNKI